jgi:glycosyltransferase involved in cell wall biosynthesis
MTERLGLAPPQVVALEEWIPYPERHRILHRTSLLAVLHHPGREAELSFRTRALDGVWGEVPLLLTEGGEVARLARVHGWGAVVPPHDPAATAAALEVLLSEREQMRCRSALARCRSQWRWSRVIQPLEEALPELPRIRRGSLLTASLAAAFALLGRPSWHDPESRQ